jgi:two-component sensor histidine kinase
MRQRFRILLLIGILLAPGIGIRAQPKPDLNDLQGQLRDSRADADRVRILLAISDWYQVQTQDQPDRFLDSVFVYARKAEIQSRSLGNQSLLGDCLLTKSWKIYDLAANRPDLKKEQKAAVTEAMRIFRATGDRRRWADANFLLARHTRSGSTERAALQVSLNTYKELGDRSRMAKTLLEMARIDYPFGDYQEARRLGLAALAIQDSIQDHNIGETLYLLSNMSKHLGDLPGCLHYALRLYQITKKSEKNSALRRVYMSLVLAYSGLGDTETALQYAYKLLQIDRKRNKAALIVQTQLKVGDMLLTLNRHQEALKVLTETVKLTETRAPAFTGNILSMMGKCYLEMQDYPKAERWFSRAVAYYKTGKPGLEWTYLELGTLYLRMDRLSLATTYLNKALQFAIKRNMPSYQRDAVLQLYKLDSIRNDQTAALAHFRQYTTLNNSLIDEAKNRQIALLKIRFDTRQKEQNIKLLQKEKILDQARINSARTTSYLSFGGATLLLAFLGLGYNRYRLKQRNNQQLEAQQREINQKNEFLELVLSEKEELLAEKEWMLKEIHHRVKNNLQIISSMLNSQYDFLNDPTALAAIRESQNRVHAIALIHQKLYQSDSLARVNMQEYIYDIADYLIESFDRQRTVSSRIDIADIHLEVALATPLGLIINEAVTNSLKYAFPKNRSGIISLSLIRIDNQTYRLVMCDDGIGLPADFDINRSKTLGLTMIRGLSKQINGQLNIAPDNGVRISLQFSMAKKPVKTALKKPSDLPTTGGG